MPLYPGMPQAPGEIALTDLRSNQEWIFSLEQPPQITSISEDNSIYVRNVAKRPGDFDEQREWKMGRGWEDFSDQPAGFLDSKDAWTMAGQVFPTIQYQFCRGLRDADFELKGSKSWKPLDSNKYISRKFTASANYDAKHIYLWIRRRGNPGTLTVELRNDNAGQPGSTIHKTITATITDITDTISELYDFVISSAYSLVSSTVYHIVAYGASGDNEANHWEVAVDESGSDSHTSTDGSSWSAASFSMYYRITDADPNRKFWNFFYDGSFFALAQYFDGSNSKLYIDGDRGEASSATATTLTDSTKSWVADRWINAWVRIIRGLGKGQFRQITDNTTDTLTVDRDWDITPDDTSEYSIYATGWWTEVTLDPALGKTTGRPAISNGVVYFPRGNEDDGSVILRMRWNSTTDAFQTAAETKYADMLIPAYENTTVLWAACNDDVIVKVSKTSGYGTALNFPSLIPVGESSFLITGMVNHKNQLWVFKEDGPWFILNGKAYRADYGMDATPSPTNGVASVSFHELLYFNWLWTTERDFSGTLDDIGQDWRGVGLPDDRQGAVVCMEPVVGWLFEAVDAGVSGTSSVLCWDGLAWHEVLRGYTSGKRIRSIKWQPCEGTRHRLWTEIEGDLIFQEFPLNNANPQNDSGVIYQHEAVIVSSAIDMGQASALPKFIRSFTAVADELGTGRSIDLDYQLDEDVGTDNWIPAGSFNNSPEDEIYIWEGDVRRFAYRLRIQTNDQTAPPVLRRIRPNGFARTPYRLIWNLNVRVGDIVAPNGQKAPDPTELTRWLFDVARFPGRVYMTSVYHLLNDFHVVVPPPTFIQLSAEQPGIPWQGVGALSLMEA